MPFRTEREREMGHEYSVDAFRTERERERGHELVAVEMPLEPRGRERGDTSWSPWRCL